MITFLIILISAPTFAQNPTPAHSAIDDAVSLCESFVFDKNTCLNTVNSKEFYQKSLVSLCAGLTGMDADKISCLGLIGNKIANERTVQACNKKTWWDNTKACISSALKEYTPPTPNASPSPTPSASTECAKEKVMDAVNKAIDQHKKMKFLPLYDTLVELKYMLKACGY